MKYDANFEKIMEYTFKTEGGFRDSQYDLGGRTNLGVTQDTYNEWRKKKGLRHKDVLYITEDEAKQLYYEEFWLPTGAAKMEDLREAYLLFDMAINSGPYNAMKWFKNSDNNIYTFLKNRVKYYEKLIKAKPSQEIHREGWMNRLRDIEQNMNNLVNEGIYIPQYQNELTPFDDEYKGDLKKVDKIDKDDTTIKNMRNKYLYLIHKKQENPTGYAANLAANNSERELLEQLKNNSIADIGIADKIRNEGKILEKFINNQVKNNYQSAKPLTQEKLEICQRLKKERGHGEVINSNEFSWEQILKDTLEFPNAMRDFCYPSEGSFLGKSSEIFTNISDIKKNEYYTLPQRDEKPKRTHGRYLNSAHEEEIERVVSKIFDSVARDMGYSK